MLVLTCITLITLQEESAVSVGGVRRERRATRGSTLFSYFNSSCYSLDRPGRPGSPPTTSYRNFYPRPRLSRHLHFDHLASKLMRGL